MQMLTKQVQEERTVMKRILAWIASSSAAASSSSSRKMTLTGFAAPNALPSRNLVSIQHPMTITSTTTTTTTTRTTTSSRSYSTSIAATSGGGSWLCSRSGSRSENHHHCHPPSSSAFTYPPPRERDSRRFQSTTSTTTTTVSTLSSHRGRNAVSLLPTYLADARSVEKYSATDCPNGALQLGVAESQLLEDWLVPALNQHFHGSDDNSSISSTTGSIIIPADAIYYQPTPGRPSLRMAMARYMEDILDLQPGRIQQQMDGIVVGAGCNAVLENLCICLADPGQAVLIPTPYYAAFEFDLVARAHLHVQPVPTRAFHRPPPNHSNNNNNNNKSVNSSSSSSSKGGGGIDPSVYYPTVEALDAAYEAAHSTGHEPRILLLSHPHNPLGICYPPKVIHECIEWCRRRQVHLVSDEIYAGSIYRNSKEEESATFSSIIKLADNNNDHDNGNGKQGGLGPYIHWVYALSKDFALSGMRIGVCYTENEEIRLPLQKLNDLCQISSQSQIWTEDMLTRKLDTSSNGQGELWTRAFRRENHARLRKRADALIACLEECKIPYLLPTAGLFCWIDLGAHLPPSSASSISRAEMTKQEREVDDAERERQLYLRLIHDFGLLLTPGNSMRNEEPGFFRIVFTAATNDEFTLGLERIRKFAVAMSMKN